MISRTHRKTALYALAWLSLFPLLIQGQTCSPVQSGLISWWPGQGNALDSGSTNHGTLTGNASYLAAKVGQGFVFDGNGDGVNVGNPANLRLQNFTIEAWIKRTSAIRATQDPANINGSILSYGGGGYGFTLLDDGRLDITQVGVGGVFSSALRITDTNFHHVALTKSDGTIVFYVDGVGETSAPYNPVFTFSSPIFIGASADLSSSFWGSIDELAVYNRALAASEIQGVFNASTVGKCNPSITTQPTNQTVAVGENATFTVVAIGSSLSYRWYFNLTNPLASTNSFLTLTNVQVSNSGVYNVVVSNSLSSVKSSNATLTINAPVCVVAPSNLVSWWAGQGNALDSGGTNHGTLVGNVSYAAARVGQGFVFDGNGDAVRVGNPASLRLQDLTVEAWIKRSSTTQASLDAGGGVIFGGGIAGYAMGFFDDGHLYLSKPGETLVSSSSQITDTNIHHVAWTKRSTSVVFYIDGVAYPAASFISTFTFTSQIAIGARGDNSGNSFLGLIDDLAVFNRALSTAEVQAIYNAGSAGKCGLPPSIISQPVSRTNNVGDDATFSVIATGTSPLSFQWRFDSTNILGAVNPTLTLTNVQLAKSGNYGVVVSNAVNSVISSNATLTVNIPICVPALSNLVSWWAGEGDATDALGGNNGTLQNGATFAAGKVGKAFNVDGGSSVKVGSYPSLTMSNSFSVDVWVFPTGPGGNPLYGGIIINKEGQYELARFADGTIQWTVANSNPGWNWVNSGFVAPVGQWTHLAWTYELGLSKIFANSLLVQSYVGSGPVGTVSGLFPNEFWIGARQDVSVNQWFQGRLDEVSLYNRALSGSEIQAIYDAGSAGKCELPAAILVQPQSRTVPAGTNVSFNVVATGSTPLSYQWRFNMTNTMVGATNNSLELSNVQAASSGSYTVIVSNIVNSVTSAPAYLNVRYAFVSGNGQNLTNTQYSFIGSVNVQLQTFFTNGILFYTLDGSQPSFASTQYTGTFAVKQSSIVRVITYSADFFQSWEIDPITVMIIPIYSLTATTAGGGTVSVTPTNGPYLSNTVIHVTATPTNGWTFLGWLGDSSDTNTPVAVTMNRNKSLQALFGTTLSTTVAGNGSVTLIPSGVFYPFGAIIQLYALPQSGNYFALWGNAGSGSSNPLNFTLTNANPTVSSVFGSLGPGEFTLAVIPSGLGQVTVNPQAIRYHSGDSVTLTPMPDAGQQFIDWSGDAGGTNNPLIVVMNTSKTITANFTRRPRLTVLSGLNSVNEQGLRLKLTGDFGGRYHIDGSTNLVDWTEQATLTNTYGATQFTDESATNLPRRFYKALTVP